MELMPELKKALTNQIDLFDAPSSCIDFEAELLKSAIGDYISSECTKLKIKQLEANINLLQIQLNREEICHDIFSAIRKEDTNATEPYDRVSG